MHKNMWEIRQEAESTDTLELYIYDTVESDGWWYDSDTSAKHFRDELAKHPNAKEITVYINSLGGSVMEGIAIYNQLKRHPAHKTVRIDGFACSIASVIAMVGDTIIMPKNTVMMIHNAWTIAIGNSKELHKAADDLETINQASRQAYLDKAGDKLSVEKLTELLDAETYLTPEQCLEYGLCDSFGDDDGTEPGADPKQRAEAAARQQLEQEQNRRKEKALAVLNSYFNKKH